MSEALKKGTVAQVKSDGVLMAMHTMKCRLSTWKEC